MDAIPKKESGYDIKDFCLTSGSRTNIPTSLGQINFNAMAAGNQT